ncbi:MAG: hypothetical protein HY665_08070 [Chloroflexi bacterium]|nr:hypothetical protein [Chloroflexota bacterium]
MTAKRVLLRTLKRLGVRFAGLRKISTKKDLAKSLPSVIEHEGRLADMAIIRDITERKKGEEAFAEKTHQTQVLLDAFPCIALLLRPSTREIVVSNRAAVEVGAVPGKKCYATWGERTDPCP